MQPVRILSLTYLDEAFTNAQQVNAREVIARLDPARLTFTAFASGAIDPRLMGRSGLRIIRLGRHGKALRMLVAMAGRSDVIWYPHAGLAESIYIRAIRPLTPLPARPIVVLPVEGDVAQLDEVPAWLRRRIEGVTAAADLVVPITRYVGETLWRRFAREGPVIPVGVDTAEFRPATERTTGPLTVVTVGSLITRKRPEVVLEAARRFPACRFMLVGDGPLRSGLERAAPANVTFAGTVSRARLPAVLRAADVLLHPGRVEGMPKAIMEGMASGIVPIAFDDYRPDWIRHGESGMVVRSDEEMFAAIALLLNDGQQQRAMGAAARRAAEAYDWGIVARMWQDLFLEVAARRRAGASMDFAA